MREFPLRGVDRIAIRRQLKLIESTFPHSDEDNITNVEQRYDIVFELSRYVFSIYFLHYSGFDMSTQIAMLYWGNTQKSIANFNPPNSQRADSPSLPHPRQVANSRDCAVSVRDYRLYSTRPVGYVLVHLDTSTKIGSHHASIRAEYNQTSW